MTIECICNLFGCCCCHRSSRRRRRCYCCCCYSNVYSENGFVSQQYIVVDHFSSRALLLGIRLLSFVRHFGLHTATPSSRVQAHDTHTHTHWALRSSGAVHFANLWWRISYRLGKNKRREQQHWWISWISEIILYMHIYGLAICVWLAMHTAAFGVSSPSPIFVMRS